MTDWRTLAAALADELTAAGKLRSPEWQAAIRAVPRHELAPVHYTMDPHTGDWTAAHSADELTRVYSNTALFVLPGGLSSTSMPSLMTRMLETLDVHDGHRVLEIGAGTGYNAALLSHRLGSEHVFALDIEPELIELARERLTGLGYHPTLVATDGAHGLPEHAPYDRIIATCSVPAVPWTWIQQTRDGGLILVDVKIGKQAGNLVLLQRHGDIAEGRFDHTYGSFMAMRRTGERYELHPGAAAQHRDSARRRSTALGLTRPWEHPVFWFYAHTELPPGTSFGLRADGPGQPPRNTVLHSCDGSWCEVREDPDKRHPPGMGDRPPPTLADHRGHPHSLGTARQPGMGTLRTHRHPRPPVDLARRTRRRAHLAADLTPEELLAADAVVVAVEVIDVLADHAHRTLHVRRSVAAAARTVDVAGDRNAGAGVVRVARVPGRPGRPGRRREVTRCRLNGDGHGRRRQRRRRVLDGRRRRLGGWGWGLRWREPLGCGQPAGRARGGRHRGRTATEDHR